MDFLIIILISNIVQLTHRMKAIHSLQSALMYYNKKDTTRFHFLHAIYKISNKIR